MIVELELATPLTPKSPSGHDSKPVRQSSHPHNLHS